MVQEARGTLTARLNQTRFFRMRSMLRMEPAAPRQHLRPRIGGQSLVEFALILPILLTLLGGAVDISRVYGAWTALEGATRDAAEQVAMDANVTTQAGAATRAQAIVCAQMSSVPGFVAPAGNPNSCTIPSLTVTWAASAVAPGTARNPLVTVTVTSALPFRTAFAYPLLTQNGAWMVGSHHTYSILQGR